MTRIVVLGAGISGHTAAMHLRRKLSRRKHEIAVISSRANWNWVPSNIWVGTGEMSKEKMVPPPAPAYRRKRVTFHQAAAKIIYPEDRDNDTKPQVEIEFTAGRNQGWRAFVHYDYLINATGPRLNLTVTSGLGPDVGNTYSVRAPDHAQQAGIAFQELVAGLKAGGHKWIVIDTGNESCTYQGTAFEYRSDTELDLHQAGVRDQVELVYLTNEEKLGGFGIYGMWFRENGHSTDSQLWIESLPRERQVRAITEAEVHEVRKNLPTWGDCDGNIYESNFDFAMLLLPFTGASLEVRKLDGAPIPKVFSAVRFMKVDGNYASKSYEGWSHKDWPSTYQSPLYRNIFVIGITSVPPCGISKLHQAPNGTNISPTPLRTGIPSGSIDEEVAMSIMDLVKKGSNTPLHEALMAALETARMASAGIGLKNGSAAATIVFSTVPNQGKYPDSAGRHPRLSFGKIGLFGHWTKLLPHFGFTYKAKWKPF